MTGESEPGTVTIRVEHASTPISGVLVRGEEETTFTGWLELAALIEAARNGRIQRSADPPAGARR